MTNVTNANAWRQANNQGTELKLPSGNTCLVRKAMGLQVFLRDGQIPNALMELVEKATSKGKPPSGQKTEELSAEDLLKNPKNLQSIIELCDNVCVEVLMEPKVLPVPRDEEGKDLPMPHRETTNDFLWVDEVDFEDKMFIFNWAVGGTSNWEKFRGELSEHVGDVSGGQDLVMPSFPPPGN